MDEKYIENLLRFIGATAYSHLTLVAAREMFGRSWYTLGPEERNSVNQAVQAQVGGNTQGLTDQLLRGWLNQAANPLGFGPPASPTPPPVVPKP